MKYDNIENIAKTTIYGPSKLYILLPRLFQNSEIIYSNHKIAEIIYLLNVTYK